MYLRVTGSGREDVVRLEHSIQVHLEGCARLGNLLDIDREGAVVRGIIHEKLVTIGQQRVIVLTLQIRGGQANSLRRGAPHALELDPADDSVRGKMRLCEGQIDRINGLSHHNTALLNEAVEKFEEAQQLLPKSPSHRRGSSERHDRG